MNTRQQKFVTEYLQWGIPCLAYANAYKKSDPNGRAIESAANRLLRNPEVKQAIHDAEDRIRHQVEREIADRQALDVFTIEQKRHLLKQIATGDMLVEQRYKTGDCRHCTQFVRPTINQMLRAIDLDNRMAAHYPPPQQTKTGKISLPGIYPADGGRGIGGQPTPDTREQQQNTTTNTCPPQAGVSRSDGGGTLASDPREQQHFATTDNTSPLQGAPIAIGVGVHLRGTQNTLPEISLPPSERQPERFILAGLSRAGFRGIGGQTTPDAREQQNTTTDNKTGNTNYETRLPFRGIGGQPTPDAREQQNTTSNNKTENTTHETRLPGIYPADGGRGIGGQPTPDTCEQQQSTTTERSELIATTKKDINPAITNTDNITPLVAGGNIAQDTPVELTTTDNKMQQSTITHDQLMELLYPKEEKLQQIKSTLQKGLHLTSPNDGL